MIKGKMLLPGWMEILTIIDGGANYPHLVYRRGVVSNAHVMNIFKKLRAWKMIERVETKKRGRKRLHRITNKGNEVLERVKYLIEIEKNL